MEARTEAQWVIERHGFEHAIGLIGFRLTGHAAELRYVLERPCWGRGYATEAAERWWTGRSRNRPSSVVLRRRELCVRAVLEKAGMECEGLLDGSALHPNRSAEPRDYCCYARVR